MPRHDAPHEPEQQQLQQAHVTFLLRLVYPCTQPHLHAVPRPPHQRPPHSAQQQPRPAHHAVAPELHSSPPLKAQNQTEDAAANPPKVYEACSCPQATPAAPAAAHPPPARCAMAATPAPARCPAAAPTPSPPRCARPAASSPPPTLLLQCRHR